MAVYMIRAGDHGPVKIGHSSDPELRLVNLQTAHWETLRIIRKFEGGEVEEIALHVKFSDLHLRGEWHSFSKAMMGDVGLVEIPFSETAFVDIAPIVTGAESPSSSKIGARLATLRKSKCLTQSDLASKVGVSRGAIAMIETGRDFPGRALLWRLDRFFGVPLIESVQYRHTEEAA